MEEEAIPLPEELLNSEPFIDSFVNY